MSLIHFPIIKFKSAGLKLEKGLKVGVKIVLTNLTIGLTNFTSLKTNLSRGFFFLKKKNWC